MAYISERRIVTYNLFLNQNASTVGENDYLVS